MREEKDKEIFNTLKGIEPMVIHMIDIPEEIRKYWSEYWRGFGTTIDYEPRLWGNDCFDGEMSSHF